MRRVLLRTAALGIVVVFGADRDRPGPTRLRRHTAGGRRPHRRRPSLLSTNGSADRLQGADGPPRQKPLAKQRRAPSPSRRDRRATCCWPTTARARDGKSRGGGTPIADAVGRSVRVPRRSARRGVESGARALGRNKTTISRPPNRWESRHPNTPSSPPATHVPVWSHGGSRLVDRADGTAGRPGHPGHRRRSRHRRIFVSQLLDSQLLGGNLHGPRTGPLQRRPLRRSCRPFHLHRADDLPEEASPRRRPPRRPF